MSEPASMAFPDARRERQARIVATLGPSSSTKESIRALFLAGVDVFRLNFSHGTHEQHRERLAQIREVERELGRPIGVLADMQGPKLRVGTFASGAVTLKPGAAFFHHADSFAMVRGGHLDLCILGGFQVAENGDLANWAHSRTETGRQIGGAMDLAVGAKRVWVVMEHVTKDGQPRLLQRCGYPLTAARCVSRVYTNPAVLDVAPQGFVVIDIIPGLSFEALQARTDAKLHRA